MIRNIDICSVVCESKWAILHFQLLIACHFSTLLHCNTTCERWAMLIVHNHNAQIQFTSFRWIQFRLVHLFISFFFSFVAKLKKNSSSQNIFWRNCKMPVQNEIPKMNWSALKLQMSSISWHSSDFYFENSMSKCVHFTRVNENNNNF